MELILAFGTKRRKPKTVVIAGPVLSRLLCYVDKKAASKTRTKLFQALNMTSSVFKKNALANNEQWPGLLYGCSTTQFKEDSLADIEDCLIIKIKIETKS